MGVSRLCGLAALAGVAACAPGRGTAAQDSGPLARPAPPPVAADCDAPPVEAQRMVCADPGLRALDAALADTLDRAMAASGRPASLARDAARWARERDAGAWDYAAEAHAPWRRDELESHYDTFLGALREELRLAAALPRVVPADGLGDTCVGEAMDQGCGVVANGRARTASGEELAWQVQSGATARDGITGGVLLFAVEGETLRLAGWSYYGAEFRPPVVFEHDGVALAAVPGVHAGSGSHNADVLYRIDDGVWREVELGTWLDSLERHLPPGLEVWRGVRFDWPALRVRTPLWRPDDGACCPSGGRAVISLALAGDSLVVTDVETAPPGAAGA